MNPITYIDAIHRATVRLPNGRQATLIKVQPEGGRAHCVELSSGRHWRGRLELLERVDVPQVRAS